MDHIYDILIIGGGPAGYTAALYAARAGLNAVVIEKMGAGGQMTLTDTIDNYPGFDEGIDGFTLGKRMQKSAERFGAKTVYSEIRSVDLAGEIKSAQTDKDAYYARSVIISTGADPRELGLENEREYIGRGIHYCAHCDGRFYKDKTVIVVGGGNTAAADALYLARFAEKVYLVHRRDTLRAEKILSDPLLKDGNVEFVWNSAVVKLSCAERINGAEVKNVNTGDIRRISADGIFISIGRKPATQFLGNALELDDSGYIIADETTKTNIDGVFAIGDVRTKPLRQIVTAVGDGAVAVHFAEEYLANITDR